ncbi:MAG TPA: sulfite exporter TauE/SafE family protein, partial [Novosphingobium capsulatum]|nr:sulfite exporter TauE/SafE family protein [Novosphingobium capsulatum]
MDVYLPIANLAVNGLVIVGLGALTGLLSGMFGVGGGFLTTPLLIFYGVPPTVAAASAASQVTGASVSGAFAHARRGGIDYHMGAVLVAGGVLGTGIGALLFRLLQALGQIDTVINILYVVLLGGIGGLMAHESITALRASRNGAARPAR